MRAFLALDISEPVRAKLGEAIRFLKPESFKVKWVDPQLMHLTLKFFGELPEEMLAPVDAALSPLARGTAPFDLRVSGLGSFGPRDRLRVLWCGIAEGAESASALQDSIEQALHPLGLPREERPFSPHLTLGRLREPSREPQLVRALEAQRDYDAGVTRADRLVLYRSTLTPQGPIYEALRRWPFEATP
jgi:2'-5' RNA ligase